MISLAIKLPALFALAGMAAIAHADPAMECGTAGGSQVETGNCLEIVEGNADAALEIVLGIATEMAGGLDAATGRKTAVPALQAGQAAWSNYRDSHCDYVGATFGGGSGTGIAIRSCRINLARARSDELMKSIQ